MPVKQTDVWPPRVSLKKEKKARVWHRGRTETNSVPAALRYVHPTPPGRRSGDVSNEGAFFNLQMEGEVSPPQTLRCPKETLAP